MSDLWAVVPAAGSGARMGVATRKQFLALRGKPLLHWSVQSLLSCRDIKGCVVALPAEEFDAGAALLPDDSRVSCCVGGASRGASVLAGLRALPAAADDWVLVHDGARPCLDATTLARLVDAVQASEIGALLAEPVTDTLKKVDDTLQVVTTVAREKLWRAQTPQMFSYGALCGALESALNSGADITDEASAMELAGHPVRIVEGTSANLKVTHGGDLALAEFHLQALYSDTVAARATEHSGA